MLAGDMGDSFVDRFEPTRLIVEVAQIVAHEGDEPDALAHLGDADALAGETWLRLTRRPLSRFARIA
jgi:hypothetical protein